MTPGRRIALLALPFALAAPVLSGCGGSEETPAAEPTPTVQVSESGITVDGEGGSLSISEGSDLPEGWPSAVVLPDGGTVTNSLSLDQEGKKGWTVTATYEDPVDSVTDAFTAALTDAGFTKDSTVSAGGQSLLAFSGQGYTVAVTLGTEGGGTAVAVTVVQE
jgi:hypothetical protein